MHIKSLKSVLLTLTMADREETKVLDRFWAALFICCHGNKIWRWAHVPIRAWSWMVNRYARVRGLAKKFWVPNIASKQTIYLRIEERYKTSNLAVAREDIYLLFYEFSEFFDEKQLFNAGSKITKIADRNGRHIGCPNGARGWSDLPRTSIDFRNV